MRRILQIVIAAVVLAGFSAGEIGASPAPTPAAQAQPPAAGQAAGQAAAPRGPQAKNKEEFDAYQKLMDPNLSPQDRLKLNDEFLVRFPESELKPMIHRIGMEAARNANDFDRVKEFADKILATDPNDVFALILLASGIPERTRENDLDREQKLTQAATYAQQALAAIDKLPKNPGMPDADFEAARNNARAQAQAALGLVALQRKQYPAAEEAFKKAIAMDKDPVVYWRLALTYQFSRKYEEARDVLKQSVSLGGVKVMGADGKPRDIAADDLARIEDFLKKRTVAPAATPAPGAAPAAGTAPAAAPAPKP